MPDRTVIEELERDLATMQERERRLPWELWTSNSYRRIKTAPVLGDRLDGQDVLCGYQCHYGVVDLSMPEDQLHALVRLANALPALLECARALEPFIAHAGPRLMDGHHALPLIPAADIERARQALAALEGVGR